MSNNMNPTIKMNDDKNTTVRITPDQTNPAIETIQTVMKGQLPSNAQADQVMEGTKQFLKETPKNDPNVSMEAQKTMHDAAKIVEATQQLLHNKNADENLQKFAQHGAESIKQTTQMGKEKLNDEKLKGTLQQTAQKVRVSGQSALEMLKYAMKNGDFRAWFLEFVSLMHDVFIQANPEAKMKLSTQNQTNIPSHPEQPTESYHQGIAQGSTQGQQPFAQAYAPIHIGEGSNITQHGLGQQQQMQGQQGQQMQGQQGQQMQGQQGQQGQRWKLNEEQKRHLSNRFVTLLRKMNGQNPEFVQGCRDLLNAIDDVKNDAKQVQGNSQFKESEDVQQAKAEAKKIVENFSGRNIDRLLSTIKDFARRLNNDQRLEQWMKDVRQVIEDCLNNPHAVDAEDFYKRIDDLVNRADDLLNDIKEREDYQYILDETKAIFQSIKNDPDVQNLQNSVEQFLKNFTTTDENGNRKLNNDLLGQMRKFIVPLLLKQLERVPIPNFEGSNDELDFKFENVVLNIAEIIPDHVHLAMASNMDINVRELGTEKAHSRALLKITNIKTKLEDVKFWFHRKVVPKMEDHGIADVSLEGDGANLTIYLELNAPFSDRTEFKFSRIDFDVDKLKIKIKETQHTVMMPIIMAVMKGKWKKDIENQIEEKIKSICHDIESGLNNLIQNYPPSKLGHMVSETVTGKAQSIFGSKDQSTESGSGQGQGNKDQTKEPWRTDAHDSTKDVPSISKH